MAPVETVLIPGKWLHLILEAILEPYHTRGVENMEDQMKVFRRNLDDSEGNYENVVSPNRTIAMKAKSDVPSSVLIASHTGCISSRTSMIILYFLVCISLLMATVAFLLAFLKFMPQCPEGWLKFQTNCYYFSADQHPWEKAMSSCLSLNAHLVVIDNNDSDKQNFLDHQKNSSYWIGLRKYPKGKWMWINGTPFQVNTETIENSETKDCVYNFLENSKSRKKKTACTNYFPYICEKEQA